MKKIDRKPILVIGAFVIGAMVATLGFLSVFPMTDQT